MENIKSKIYLIVSMFTFGTIGIFVKYIPFSSSVIAFWRGFIGMLFLGAVLIIKGERIDKTLLKRNLVLLCVSGGFIGINWILLFESYRYTTVATATLCYYMAPVFVIIASSFFFKEKLGLKKVLCVVFAVFGMVLVSGVLKSGFVSSELKGVLFGLGAALFYSGVILLNKKIKDFPPLYKTAFQLGSAALVILPYMLFSNKNVNSEITAVSVVLLAVVSIVHTGLAYTLYFAAVSHLKAQTTAILSYIDPVVAVILSAVVLREKTDILTVIGAVIILCSAFISELPQKKK